jgi:hypothetical protein
MEAAVINDPRAYQIEMLEESKKRNIIVAVRFSQQNLLHG